MRVTTHSDYALRVLIFAGLRGGEPSRIDDIAKRYRISKSHLTKVVWKLSQAGFLKTTRGRAGGLTLAALPAEINLGAVMREMEGFGALVECFGPENKCIITTACAARRMFREAHEAFFAVFDKYTLADLLDRRPALVDVMQLDAAVG